MPTATDGLGRTLELKRAARRVVSLVPSLTEAVAVFGKPTALVGCTKFCEEPPHVVDGLRKLGGTKDPDIDAIVALEPDLVLANKEENRQEDVEALIAAGLNVYVGDARSVSTAIDELEQVTTLISAVPFRALREMRAELDRQTQLVASPSGDAIGGVAGGGVDQSFGWQPDVIRTSSVASVGIHCIEGLR